MLYDIDDYICAGEWRPFGYGDIPEGIILRLETHLEHDSHGGWFPTYGIKYGDKWYCGYTSLGLFNEIDVIDCEYWKVASYDDIKHIKSDYGYYSKYMAVF